MYFELNEIMNQTICCIIYHYFPNILLNYSTAGFYSQLSTIKYKIKFLCQYKKPIIPRERLTFTQA